MKANEFRIGNWVRTAFGTDAQIIMIDNDRVDEKPIPLTEEWLIRFGFVKHSINPFWFRRGMMCVSILGKVELISWDMRTFKIDIDIDYVHQLQNLYFALTGEELTINPSTHQPINL